MSIQLLGGKLTNLMLVFAWEYGSHLSHLYWIVIQNVFYWAHCLRGITLAIDNDLKKLAMTPIFLYDTAMSYKSF